MGAGGAVAGQFEHPRPQRAEQPRHRRGRRRAPPLDRVEAVEVGAHGRQRLGVVVPARVDQRLVRDAEPEREPPGMRLGQREGTVARRCRVARPDVGDARRHGDPLGRPQEQPRMRERLLLGQ
jgi:hypothetical protein